MSNILDILIPLGFVGFLLFILEKKFHWYQYVERGFKQFKSMVIKWSK